MRRNDLLVRELSRFHQAEILLSIEQSTTVAKRRSTCRIAAVRQELQ